MKCCQVQIRFNYSIFLHVKTKLVATRHVSWAHDMLKMRFAAVALPKTSLGSLQLSPDILARLGGPLRGEEGQSGEGCIVEGEGREKRQKGNKGKEDGRIEKARRAFPHLRFYKLKVK